MSNHLGNVLVTISDRKVAVQNGTTGLNSHYLADVTSAQDYYPFGMSMPERKYEAQSGYRYGFNGKEKDKDMNSLTAYDYGFRIYNPGIGKFLSVDPLTESYPYYTPYQFAGNMPIWAIDLDGLEEYIVIKELYKNGKTKRISIQYTVTKDDPKQKVNMQFKELLGKNPDGSEIMGDLLTGFKVVRIIRDANKNETVEYDDELNKEEARIEHHNSRNEQSMPKNDAWELVVNRKKYTSGITRDETKQQDKVATKKFNLITNLNPKFGAVPFYLSADGMGKIVDDKNYTENSAEKEFFNLPKLIREDGGIKSIKISYTLYLYNEEEQSGQFSGQQKSLENIRSEVLKLYGESATGVKNITVDMKIVRTSDPGKMNVANPTPLKVELSRQ